MDTFVALKFLGRLALPPASLLLGLVLAGLLRLIGFRRLARVVVVLAVGQILLMSLPPVADLLVMPLEREARAESAKAAACCYEAIVVLGGAVTPAIPPYLPDPQLTDSSDRVWLAARLFRRGVAPRIIVSGTGFQGEQPAAMTEAGAMRQFLVDLGVPAEAIVQEGKARNTLENVAFVRELVNDKPVALITSAYHMPRAMRLARRAGLEAFAFPATWFAPADARTAWENWLPTLDALSTSVTALWEYMALAFDRRGAPNGS
jgi:uncharacterized SAM-binding protein YcdF (DUF218 family)